MAENQNTRSAARSASARPDVEAPVLVRPADEPDLFVVPDDLLESFVPALAPDRDAIAERAHAIHVERGGTAFDNWIAAERELGEA